MSHLGLLEIVQTHNSRMVDKIPRPSCFSIREKKWQEIILRSLCSMTFLRSVWIWTFRKVACQYHHTLEKTTWSCVSQQQTVSSQMWNKKTTSFYHMGVSKNRGTPKSFILISFSTIFGNFHIPHKHPKGSGGHFSLFSQKFHVSLSGSPSESQVTRQMLRAPRTTLTNALMEQLLGPTFFRWFSCLKRKMAWKSENPWKSRLFCMKIAFADWLVNLGWFGALGNLQF